MKVSISEGDCLDLLKKIPDGSIDMVLTDPPYGTINGMALRSWSKEDTSWDNKLDWIEVWKQLSRVVRANGAILFFAQEPFTNALISSSPSNIHLSYRCVWLKNHFANGLIAKKAPVSYFEDICVFHKKYERSEKFLQENPAYIYLAKEKLRSGISTKQFNLLCSQHQNKTKNPDRSILARAWERAQFMLPSRDIYINVLQATGFFEVSYDDLYKMYQSGRKGAVFNLNGFGSKPNVFRYKKDKEKYHPTQKPVALLEDLVLTYTNQGDTVLDFTMGSGSTGVACMNTGRNFIGFEKEKRYYETASNRLMETAPK